MGNNMAYNPKSKENLETEKYKFSANCPELAQIAQKKSVESRNENGSIKKWLKTLLKEKPEGTDYPDNAAYIAAVMIKQSIEGNTQAQREVIDRTDGKESITTELTGSVDVQKIFITPEEHDATLKHIEDVINDKS